jgi:hypothetical protein
MVTSPKKTGIAISQNRLMDAKRALRSARLLARWFRKAAAWRLLDGAIGGMVLLVAAAQFR